MSPPNLQLGRRTFAPEDRVVMAIVNRTPDSFYDGGRTFGDDTAMAAVDAALASGAEIVDIGGVKAGPGDDVDVDAELGRTVDFVAAVRERHPEAVISVDTWRHEVGDAVCRAGADLLNDAWGGFDPQLVDVAAAHGVGIVCTHTGGSAPRTRPHRVEYEDVVGAVVGFLEQEAARAEAAGVGRQRILIDPGHDFGKNTRHSLAVTRHIDRLVATWEASSRFTLKQGLRRRDPGRHRGRPTRRNAGGDRRQLLAGSPGFSRARGAGDARGARDGAGDRWGSAAGGCATRVGIGAEDFRTRAATPAR